MIKDGFRFYSFEISTAELSRNTYLVLRDDDRKLMLPVQKNQTQHLYGNVVTRNRPEVYFEDQFELTEHAFGDDVFIHPNQVKRNAELSSEDTISYKVRCQGTPRRAVITFPQHPGFGGWLAPYPIFHAEKLAIDDCLYISFQDPYLTSGSYFLVDNAGHDPMPQALGIIRRELERYGLREENTTLLGSSKGANIAALASQHLTGNQLILCNYSTELDYRLRNNFLSYLAETLDILEVKIPDALEILSREAECKETHWLYTVGDNLANRGHEDLTGPKLSTYASSNRHGDVLRGNWDFIKELITNYHEK